jgi:UDP-glucuronate 4-epimerase
MSSQTLSNQTVLVTGSAGFIGYHLSERLLAQGFRVVGLDNLNDYYSVELKEARNERLKRHQNYRFVREDLSRTSAIKDLFKSNQFSSVFHLAAQAGVRYSIEKPEAYTASNIDGTLSILEAARYSREHHGTTPNMLMASSSSVYGLSTRYPFREDDPADRPVALYGATKRANELMGHSYSHLFGLRITMLRFFSVYGPWGRPDVALYKFCDQIMRGEEVEVYNNGDMIRDFTYVDDIVDGILALQNRRGDENLPLYDVFNIGCSNPRKLMDFFRRIEQCLKREAKIRYVGFQPGDIYKSYADVTKLQELCQYAPKVQMEEGVESFVRWYLDYSQGSLKGLGKE